jgi:predicted Zn-dependent protease
MLKLILIAGLFITLTGCVTTPITGRQQLALVSEAEVIQASAQAYAAQLQEYREQGKIEQDPQIVSRVQGIAKRIIDQAVRIRPETGQWKWQVKVIDSPEVNAFAMAGGKLVVFTGLINQLNLTDDELAQVIAHEIAHALADHTREKVSVSLASQLAVSTVGSASGVSPQLLGTAAALAVQLPNSRGMEAEADRIGIELAARAGYDPQAAVFLWSKMGQLQGRGVPQFLSTHPSGKTRMQTLQKLVPQMIPLYQAARG